MTLEEILTLFEIYTFSAGQTSSDSEQTALLSESFDGIRIILCIAI